MASLGLGVLPSQRPNTIIPNVYRNGQIDPPIGRPDILRIQSTYHPKHLMDYSTTPLVLLSLAFDVQRTQLRNRKYDTGDHLGTTLCTDSKRPAKAQYLGGCCSAPLPPSLALVGWVRPAIGARHGRHVDDTFCAY